MKMKSGRFAVILAYILSVLLTSCGDASVVQTETDTLTDAVETEEDILPPNFPDNVDFGGKEFNFLSRAEENGYWTIIDLWDGDTETGEVLNDAIFKRTSFIEEELNCKLIKTNYSLSEMANVINETVSAGDDTFQVALITNAIAPQVMSNHLLIDLNTVSTIDLTQPWWNQNLNRCLSINGKQYYAIGDINIMAKYATSAMLFNKNLAEDYKIPNLYEMVDNGTWTIDKYAEIAVDLNRDLNNDGVMNMYDFWGADITVDVLDYHMVGCHAFLTSKDKNDAVSINPLDDHMEETLGKIMKVYQLGNVFDTHIADFNPKAETGWRNQFTIFTEDRALFFIETVRSTYYLRDMESEYGLIPIPKFDENQENYTAAVQAHGSSVTAIPVTAANTYEIGLVLEALSYTARKDLNDVFYNNVCYKGLRDDESVKVLNIMFDNMYFEQGSAADYGELFSSIRNKALYGKNEYASVYASCYDAAVAELQKLTDSMK